MTNPLEAIARDLAYAAGAGGAQLAQGLSASARQQLEIGAAVSVPGPGLVQLTKRRSGVAVSQAAAPAEMLEGVASRTATAAADGGAALALGKRR